MAAPLRLAALAVLLPLAGCGSQAARTSATAPASHAAATATAAHASAAKTTKVAIKDFQFTPAKVTVAKGTRIAWTNKDAANHTVTFAKGPGNLGNLNRGKSRSATFTKAGTYKYVCMYHPNMHGTVVVK